MEAAIGQKNRTDENMGFYLNNTLSCASSFCDFYPLIDINPISLKKYLDSFSSHSSSVAIPFFLSDFLLFLRKARYCCLAC